MVDVLGLASRIRNYNRLNVGRGTSAHRSMVAREFMYRWFEAMSFVAPGHTGSQHTLRFPRSYVLLYTTPFYESSHQHRITYESVPPKLCSPEIFGFANQGIMGPCIYIL